MALSWSPYQNKVYDYVAMEEGNLVIEAVAGSGKSTTLKEIVRRIPEDKSILVLAFNKHIKEPLAEELSDLPNVEVATLNSFGFRAVRDGYMGRVKLDARKTGNILRFEVLDDDDESKHIFYGCVRQLSKIIALRKSLMVWEPYDNFTIERMVELMDAFDIDEPTAVPLKELYELTCAVWSKSMADQRVVDFDDQLAFPIFHNLRMDTYDYILVDEAQDLSPVQIELTKRAIDNEGGRAIYCGDRKQAIYQFRGADSRAIQRIESELGCATLPLSICYRCGSTIVDLAREIVPQIESVEGAPDGEIKTIYANQFKPKQGDIVLCRTTAPLVDNCLRLIREGQKATVKGRDIGQSLMTIVKKVKGVVPESPIEEFLDLLDLYASKQREALSRGRREQALQTLEDKVDTLLALASHVKTVGDLGLTIEKIFSDDKNPGVFFMTVHKAKGLEAPHVYIIRPDLMPHPKARDVESEMNIKYVAITRAMERLTFVNPEDAPAPVNESPEASTTTMLNVN
jgi:superfamily I DNA/RNA helicase